MTRLEGRHGLIVEAFLKLGEATQTEVEEWIRAYPRLAEMLDEDEVTKERINSWVAVYINRMRKRGIVEVVGSKASRQSSLRQAKVFALARGVCPNCALTIPHSLLNVSGVVDSTTTQQ
jgi:hypothetical protein